MDNLKAVSKLNTINISSDTWTSSNIQLSNRTKEIKSVNINNDGSAQQSTYFRCSVGLDFDAKTQNLSNLVYSEDGYHVNNGNLNDPLFFRIDIPYDALMGQTPVIRLTGFQLSQATRAYQIQAIVIEEKD